MKLLRKLGIASSKELASIGVRVTKLEAGQNSLITSISIVGAIAVAGGIQAMISNSKVDHLRKDVSELEDELKETMEDIVEGTKQITLEVDHLRKKEEEV